MVGSLFDIDYHSYIHGCDFWCLGPLSPLRGFMTCAFGKMPTFKIDIKIRTRWYGELEQLTLRIDAHPRDREKLEEMERPEEVIHKLGGGPLHGIQEESDVWFTWKGLDLGGNRVEWCSVAYVWRSYDFIFSAQPRPKVKVNYIFTEWNKRMAYPI